MFSNATAAGLLVSSVAALLVPVTSSATATETPTPSTLVAVDGAAAAGLRGRQSETYAAAPVDSNRDGAQDVWIGYHGEGAKLWRNQGNGTYTRVARTAWPKANDRHGHIDRHDCAWADVDRNGRPDAYCSTGRMNANVVKHRRDNELWLQGRGGGFREVGTEWGVGDVCGRGRQVTFINVNGDRWPDLFLGNDAPRQISDPCDRRANRLSNERGKIFINVRGTRFRHVRPLWNFGTGIGTRCAEVLDFNRDGWQDLLACRGPNQTPRLYRNMAGRRFADVTRRHRLVDAISDAVVADLDKDGDPDIVTSSGEGFAYHPFSAGKFRTRVWVGRVGIGEGGSVAVGDADGDGDRDVYGMAWDGRTTNPDDQVWINDRLNFSAIPVPSAEGAGDEVVALDPRGNGRAAFLVLNGYGPFTPGAVQLIKVVRR